MQFSHFIILASLSFSFAGRHRGIKDTWSFDLGFSRISNWMSKIGNDVPLSALTIPGTHSSMSYELTGSLTQTQNNNLACQLLGGIRYFDISCQYTNGNIMVYNGLVKTGFSLGDVLNTMFNFLDGHPQEALILRIRKGGMLGDSKKLLDFIEQYFTPGSEMGDRAAQYIYFSDGDEATIPTLGEVRGKVVILRDFKSSPPARYGIPWNSNTVSSYSRRLAVGSVLRDLGWTSIRSHLSHSRSEDANKLRITHTTASVSINPINTAAKNDPGRGMNQLLGRYIMSIITHGEGNCFGIIVMDFPGRSLVYQMVRLNEQYQASEPSDLPPHHDDLPIPGELVDDINYDGINYDVEATSSDEDSDNDGDAALVDDIIYDERYYDDEVPPVDEDSDNEGGAALVG
ncbi:1-phosphatidylinositol phosphodiesterase [Ceratocystis lukuohia]|uniref:1-phosphatidylinositol phosphodiesterase n=1 Tax=Ceratocystis lukuohia TaxID=2019550 RepID=A0ABR4MA65_9PEZI